MNIFNIDFTSFDEVPIYNSEYGFVDKINIINERCVDLNDICISNGVEIKSRNKDFYKLLDLDDNLVEIEKCADYDFKGAIFRIDLPIGIYDINVEVIGESIISISNLNGNLINKKGYWDSTEYIEKNNVSSINNNIWSYKYFNHDNKIFIEVEPKNDNNIILKSIKINTVDDLNKKNKPTLYLLGDSTVKNYTHAETPLSGWGQQINYHFDMDLIDIKNYSQGGRALKSMYSEGRFNDILLNIQEDDFIFIQSGHNDEKEDVEGVTNEGTSSRFGRGSNIKLYEKMLKEIYIPALLHKKVNIFFITPMTRVKPNMKENQKKINSFSENSFPDVMRAVAKEYNIPLIDLNKGSVDYLNELGKGVYGLFMYIEAGETVGIQNELSLANGNPVKEDGTHFRETLAKHFSRIVIELLYKLNSTNYYSEVKKLLNYINDNTNKQLYSNGEYYFEETMNDCIKDEDGKYRDAIEKMVILGAIKPLEENKFYPRATINKNDYIRAFKVLFDMNINIENEFITRKDVIMSFYELIEDNQIKEDNYYFFDGYNPLVKFEELKDVSDIEQEELLKIKKVWDLGLIRSDVGIKRGKCVNGEYLELNKVVTRELACKYLYFIWQILRNPKEENNSRKYR